MPVDIHVEQYLTVFKCLTVSACTCRERVKRQRLRYKRRALPISTFFAGRWILTTSALKKVRVKYPYNKASCSTFCPACCFLDLSVGLFFFVCVICQEYPKKNLFSSVFCQLLFFVVFFLYPQILLISFDSSGVLAHMLFPSHTNMIIYVYTDAKWFSNS